MTHINQAYTEARYIIDRLSDSCVCFEDDFDSQLDGSSITDKLIEIIHSTQKKLIRTLDKCFIDSFDEKGQNVIDIYNCEDQIQRLKKRH